jgi:hypothetical protein
MDSLQWVDQTYIIKHKDEDRAKLRGMYCQNLRLYSTRDGSTHSKSLANTLKILLLKLGMKAATSLGIFCLSYLPVIGRFVLPGVSFYAFKKAVGLGPAALIFGTSIFLPRKFLVVFLQSYFTSRTLMRDLVGNFLPYRNITNDEKARAIFLTYSVHERAKEALVPRPGGPTIRLWCWVLHTHENSTPWSPRLWNCRSFYCLSDYKNY